MKVNPHNRVAALLLILFMMINMLVVNLPVYAEASVAPTLISAGTDATGAVIEAKFDKAMADPSSNKDQFTVDNGAADLVTAAVLKTGDATVIVLTLTNAIQYGQTVTVAYTAGTVTSADTVSLAAFAAHNVINNVPQSVTIEAPLLASASTNADGTQIEVKFSKAMADPTGQQAQFTVNNGTADPVTAAALKTGDNTVIGLTLTNAIQYGQTVTVAYAAGTVASADTGALATFTAQTVTNNVPAALKQNNQTTSITISAARTQATGNVTVTGIVTYVSGSNHYIQDSTAGINIYGAGLTANQGDQITVSGTLSDFNGLLEITAPTIDANTAGSLPEPQIIDVTNAITGNYESQLVKIKNVTLGATSGNYTSVTETTNTINIYKMPTLTGIQAGDTVDIIAIASDYNGAQLLVRSASDITKSVNLPTSPSFVSAATDAAGLQIEVKFDKAMADPTGKHAQFTVNNGAANPVTAAALKSGDATVIILTLTNAILNAQTVTVAYTAGAAPVTDADTGVLATFTAQTVNNTVAAPGDKIFDIVEITDLHGNLVNSSNQPVVAGVMAENIRDNIYANNPDRTLILSGGDNYQGTAISNLQYGDPVMKVFNAMGVAASALGNHEFDWGLEKVANINGSHVTANYPIICANLFPKGNTTTPVFDPYEMFTLDGVKIAVVGGITEKTPSMVLDTNIANYDVLSNVTYINKYAQEARDAGAQIVIALIHEGDNYNNGASGPIVDIAHQLAGVDAVLGGHTHTIVQTTVTNKDGKLIPLEIANSSGKGYIDLKITQHTADGTFTFDNATSAYVAEDYSPTTSNPGTTYPYSYKAAAPVVDQAVAKIVTDVLIAEGPILNEVLGSAQINMTRTQADSPYGESLAGNWAADVTRQQGNAEVGFQNNGGLRIDIPQGQIIMSTIYGFMPFDNVVMTCDMTGAQLKVILEEAVMDNGMGIQLSGLKFTYNPALPSGSRVTGITKNDGTPIDINDTVKTYKVATNDFLAGGTTASPKDGFTFASQSSNMTNTYILIRDALADNVRAAGTTGITANIEGRMRNQHNDDYFVQVTDLHLCNTADAQKYLYSSPNYDPEVYAAQFVNDMKSLKPSFVVATGDLVALADTKTITTGKKWFDLYNQDVATPLKNAGIALYNISGNHDQGGTNYSKYKSIDDVPVADQPYYANGLFTQETGNLRFYSFDQGDYHYIALDPDETGSSSTGVGFVQLSQEQMTWLQSDLQANQSKNIILFFHQPSSDWSNWADVANILRDYKVKMIFDGHWHLNTVVNNGLPEQSTGALCGSWWRSDSNKDGTPYGYRLVQPTSTGVSSFYKNLGSSQQINLITPDDIAISGQVALFAQAYDANQPITTMQYRIDSGDWQKMSLAKVALWYEGKAVATIASDGQYHQIEISYTGADGSSFSSSKLFKFDANPVIDINSINENFSDFQGRYATVAATVTAAFDVGNMPVLQDKSGAMTVWSGECTGCPAFAVGTGVKVRGQVSTDGYDVKQLQVHLAADVTSADIDTNNTPKLVTIPEVGDACYQLVKLQGVMVTEIIDKSDIYVQDQAKHRLLIYTGEHASFDCTTSLHIGDTMDISGIAWIYKGEPEICTRSASDLGKPGLATNVKIAVLSDPHYFAPELGTSGAAFDQYLASDRKMIAESKAILESTVDAIKNSDAQIVLVTGDLTKDGELLSHQQFAGYLQQLKDAGKQVYVIDGNHDINNPHASSYSGDKATPVPYITPAEFRVIYEGFGYGDAVATDTKSLSYAVDPIPGLRIIAMDSALYDTNIADNTPKTAGAFSTDRQAWIDKEIADGVAQGMTVIGMMHHGVTNHFSLESTLFPEYVIQNADAVAADLSSKGMKVVFTGHFHAQDITKQQTSGLFDVETGSLVTYPVPYRLADLGLDGSLSISSQRINSINYNTGGKSFQNYAKDFLVQGLNGLVPQMLAGIIMQQHPEMSASDAMAAAASAAAQPLTPTLTVKDCLVNAMVAHYQGDEQCDPQLLAVYQQMYGSNDSLNKTLGGALLSLNTDLAPGDNNADLNLITGAYTQPVLTAPKMVSASTDKTGKKVLVEFDKTMADPSGKQTEFSVVLKAVADAVQSVSINPTDSNIIELTLTTPAANGNALTIAYTKGTVKSNDGGALESFTAQNVANNTAADAISKVTATINGDPTSSEGFTWYTQNVSVRSDLQVVEQTGPTPDFSQALKFTGLYGVSTNDSTQRVHKAKATDLNPGTTYAYRVGDEAYNIWSEVGTFQTAPVSGAFTFVDLTDTQANDDSEATLSSQTIAKALETVDDAKFVALNGDIVETGNIEGQWDWMLGHSQDSLLNTTIVPITGNHEKQPNSFMDHFDVKPAAGSDSSTGAYYSYDYSNAHFLVLNTNESSTDYADFSPAQVQWMQADVSAARAAGAKWIIAIMHKGPYTTSNHATDSDIMGANGVRNKVAPIMANLGIDLVLQGHDHIYARSKPIKADGTAVNAAKTTETFNGSNIEYTLNPGAPIYLIPNAAGAKVYYKNKTIDPSYYSLFDVADESHSAPYGPDSGDATRPLRGQIQNFEGITIDGDKLSVISYEIDQSKNGAKPYVIDSFGITKPIAAVSKVTATINGDPSTSEGFTWYTGAASAGSDIQLVENRGQTPDFSQALSFTGLYAASTNVPTQRVHKAKATGLKPGTTYSYRVGDVALDIWSATGTFQTAPASGAFTFIDLADTQAKTEDEAILSSQTIAKALNTVDGAKFVALNGDVVDTGSNEGQWDWLLGHTQTSLLNTTIIPAAGNHEKETNSFIEHFEVKPADGSATTTGAYYSYNYSNAHFLVLNNNETSTEYADFSLAQIQWMQADVAAARAAGAKWIVAIMHKGPYTTSNHATDSDIMGANGVRTKVAPIMASLGIDLVLQGHDHIYARSKPIKADGTAASVEKITETFNGQNIEYTQNPGAPIYLIPSTAGPKVYYKNKTIDSSYYNLFDVADESHAAPYGPDPGDATRPLRSQIQNFESITIDGSKLSVISYEIDQSKDDAKPYVIDSFGITKQSSVAPISKVTATINGDPTSSEGFTWYTNLLSSGTNLQVIEKVGATPDFSQAAKFTGLYALSSNDANQRMHKAEATGLKPGTTYCYRVGDAALDMWSATGTFQTAPVSGTFTFVDLADTQANDESEATLSSQTIAKALNTVGNANFVALNGDVVETGNVEGQWDWMLNHSQNSLMNTTIIPIAGNHEAASNSFIQHFDIKPADNGQDTSKGAYYSYNYSNAHFIVLNTNDSSSDYADFGTAQMQWMQSDVQTARAAGAKWIIVILHKGPYTTANHATDTDIMGANGLRTKVAPAMENLGIDLVLQGHDHIYARTKPIKADGTASAENQITETLNGQSIKYTVNPDGTIYLIPGAAGAKVYYKNTKISDPANTNSYVAGYYDLFDVADQSHAAVYGSDPADSTRPARSQIQNFEGITIDGDKLSIISYEIDQNKNNAQPYVIDSFGISRPTTVVPPATIATIKSLTVWDSNQQPVTTPLVHGRQYYLKWKANKNSDGTITGLAIVEVLDANNQAAFLNAARLPVTSSSDTDYSVLFQPTTSGNYKFKGFYWNDWSNNASWQSLSDPVEAAITVN